MRMLLWKVGVKQHGAEEGQTMLSQKIVLLLI